MIRCKDGAVRDEHRKYRMRRPNTVATSLKQCLKVMQEASVAAYTGSARKLAGFMEAKVDPIEIQLFANEKMLHSKLPTSRVESRKHCRIAIPRHCAVK